VNDAYGYLIITIQFTFTACESKASGFTGFPSPVRACVQLASVRTEVIKYIITIIILWAKCICWKIYNPRFPSTGILRINHDFEI